MGAERASPCKDAPEAGAAMKQSERIAGIVRQLISEGQYPPAKPLPSYRALSRRYNTSVASVIKGMKLLEREGIVRCHPRRGTFARPSAPIAAEGPTRVRCINFVTDRTGLPVVHMRNEYLEGYTQALEHRDIRMRFFQYLGPADLQDQLVLGDIPSGEQGCIFLHRIDLALRDWLRERHIPFVLQHYLGETGNEATRYHRVHVNKFAGAFEATEYLIGLGHRRIGYVGVQGRQSVTPFQGYRAAMTRAGFTAIDDDALSCRAEAPEEAVEPAREFLLGAGRPTAVLAGNDATAIGMIEAAHALGIRVPEDLSVVGFNDEPEAEAAPVPLTTVTNPRRLLAATAVEMLLTAAAGGYREFQTRVLECHLVIRKSTVRPMSS